MAHAFAEPRVYVPLGVVLPDNGAQWLEQLENSCTNRVRCPRRVWVAKAALEWFGHHAEVLKTAPSDPEGTEQTTAFEVSLQAWVSAFSSSWRRVEIRVTFDTAGYSYSGVCISQPRGSRQHLL